MKKQLLRKSPPKSKPKKFKFSQSPKPLEKIPEKVIKTTFQFPIFSRSFPAIKLKKLIPIKLIFFYTGAVVVLYFAIIIAILSISMDIYKNTKIEQEVYAKRNTLVFQKDYWEKVVLAHPGYRDAYYNLAILELQMRNKEKAKYYLGKLFEIDPNFEKGRELEKRMTSK